MPSQSSVSLSCRSDSAVTVCFPLVQIGLQAFAEGHMNVSIDWLELSLLKYQAAATAISAESKAHILATLARAYRKVCMFDVI